MTAETKQITVFIENESGSNLKHHYDEATLQVVRIEQVGGHYPYPYGFVPHTLAPDGDAADCFVLTDSHLESGDRVLCDPIALLEQTEGGDVDHNVIAVVAGEPIPELEVATRRIEAFIGLFRRDDPDAAVSVGALLGSSDASTYLEECAKTYLNAQSGPR